jgi:hypothetical protein
MALNGGSDDIGITNRLIWLGVVRRLIKVVLHWSFDWWILIDWRDEHHEMRDGTAEMKPRNHEMRTTGTSTTDSPGGLGFLLAFFVVVSLIQGKGYLNFFVYHFTLFWPSGTKSIRIRTTSKQRYIGLLYILTLSRIIWGMKTSEKTYHIDT